MARQRRVIWTANWFRAWPVLLIGALLLVALLSGCSALSGAKVETVEDEIRAACGVERVRFHLPDVCADPKRFAEDAVLAAEVLRIIKVLLL